MTLVFYTLVSVDLLSATLQTNQFGQGMLRSAQRPTYQGPLHLLGDDGAEFMAVFTHGEL